MGDPSLVKAGGRGEVGEETNEVRKRREEETGGRRPQGPKDTNRLSPLLISLPLRLRLTSHVLTSLSKAARVSEWEPTCQGS